MNLPFKNKSSAVIKKLTKRNLKANKITNIFIVVAITLTTLLIGSVFSVGMSLIESINMEQTRFAGTLAHAAVGHPTDSQIEQLKKLNYVKLVGTGNNVGFVKNTEKMGKISLTLHYFDETEWEKLRSPTYVDVEGYYPQKENEIMISRSVLKRMGIDNPYIGMEIPLSYYIESENKDSLIQETFRLSGWFTSYAFVQSSDTADVMLVSHELSQKYGKTVEKDGSASVLFVNKSKVSEYCNSLSHDLNLSDNQPVAQVQLYKTDSGQEITTFLSLCAIAIFIIFTGYLLIYNVLYISISRDVRFYGLLKTLGTTSKQIKQMVIRQIIHLCLIGIPIGIALSLLLSIVVVPFFVSGLGAISSGKAVVSFSPLIYVCAIIFPFFTAILGALKPAKKASNISPIEAHKYIETIDKTKNIKLLSHGRPYRMAWRNVFRDKKRAYVVLLSLFLGMTTFLSVTTLVFSMDITKYVDSNFESDFVLENNVWPTQKFDDSFIEYLSTIPGIEEIHQTTWGKMKLDYTDSFDKYISNHPMQEQIASLSKQDISENFNGFILGVDGETISKYLDKLGNQIDVEAFNRGETALVATDHPEFFSNIQELTISPSNQIESSSGVSKYKLTLGGFVPFNYKNIGSGLAPTLIVSNDTMKELFKEPVVEQLDLNVSNGSEESVSMTLKQLVNNDSEISLTSKMQSIEDLNHAKMTILILGCSISLIISIIGILNFVNIMSVSILVRKRELAILQAVGMSRKNIKKMLINEGLFYAIIALTLVLSLGNIITYIIFKLFQNQVSFAVFTYPFIPMLILVLLIIIVCISTSERMCHFVTQKTISQQLRESE